MKKTTIYVDTSVIGGCCDSEFHEWSNDLLKDFQSGIFTLLLSELTDAEVQDAPDEVKKIYAKFRKCASKIIELTPEAIELADAYLKHRILTHKYRDGLQTDFYLFAEGGNHTWQLKQLKWYAKSGTSTMKTQKYYPFQSKYNL